MPPHTTRILPPYALLLAIALMFLLHKLLPLVSIEEKGLRVAGWCLIVCGLAVDSWIALWFQRQGTTILPFRDSSQLVTTGLYRYSRNPIYVSMVVVLVGVVLALGSVGPLLAIPLFIAWINRRVILVEEAMLRERFGAEYEAYCRRVRRWV
ncbi:MAG: isoprenylcysteine carboxylmethyltransferase family protein [Planctomycetales bacterium]|nr:isoprenylcysteine carboxylmethyltransferase family protein [Planctomycetales bacterium]